MQKAPALNHQINQEILGKVLATIRTRFYRPEMLDATWARAVETHRPNIEQAYSPQAFEEAVSELLKQLKVSHVGFFHVSAQRASSRAALSATYLEEGTEHGQRWVFQGVHSGGAAATVGIMPGDLLVSVNGTQIVPPDHPVFAMGSTSEIEIEKPSGAIQTVHVDVARPKGKKLHFIEPILVEARRLDADLGYIKISMFPGTIGVDVANQISVAAAELEDTKGLVLDLRGNTGGGVGSLRVMSLLTPKKIPVGFSLRHQWKGGELAQAKNRFVRFNSIPSKKSRLWLLSLRFLPVMLKKSPIVLETEGLGTRSFQGNIVIVVDRHTASAAEMIVAFAKENNLATVVGENTAGRLLSATSVKVGYGYRLALPVGAYHTWSGGVLEGTPIPPDDLVPFSWKERKLGYDRQLERSVELVRSRL